MIAQTNCHWRECWDSLSFHTRRSCSELASSLLSAISLFPVLTQYFLVNNSSAASPSSEGVLFLVCVVTGVFNSALT